jgi:glycosyltransferase involved in cell wall biosynthesis
MLKVAIDARRLQETPYTGTGRRIANLVPLLAEHVDVVLLTDKRKPSPRIGDFEEVRLPVPGKLPEPFWLQGSVAWWLRGFAGVFHGTYNAVPIAHRGPSVVTIHDLTWEHHYEGMTPARRLSFLLQARASARRAKVVVTVSEFVRQDLIATYKLSPDRVFAAPPSVDPIFSPQRVDDLPPILDRLRIDRPYVIALGGTQRRGLDVAVEAWRRLPASAGEPMLVVVGAEVPPLEKGIVHAGRVDDDEWSALLAGATAFCYPTRYEGYGMPALEAAASGVPVVCASVASLPEVLGSAAQWCATPGVDDIADGLQQVLVREKVRETLRKDGLARAAAAPTWEQAARIEAGAYTLSCQMGGGASGA